MGHLPDKTRSPGLMTLEKRLMLDASLQILSNQVLWLDAADASTVLDGDGDNASTGMGGANNGFGGTVATWLDKSVQNNPVSSGAAADRPTYTAGGLNGLSTITFDGVNDYLSNTTGIMPSDDFTFFVVFNRTTGVGDATVFEIGGGSDEYGLHVNESGSNTLNYNLNGTITNSASTYTPGTFEMVTMMQDLTTFNMWRNNVNTIINGTGVAPFDTTGFFVGDDFDGGDSLQGSVAEIIVYNRDLTPDERRDVENYLASKWGLAIPNATPTIGTNVGMNTFQGTAETLTAAMLAATDADNTDSRVIYTITNAQDYGTLTNVFTGQTLGVGDTFTQADIDNSYIIYTHDNSLNLTDSMQFTVNDQYSTSGVFTFNFNITQVNQAPSFLGWTVVGSDDFEGPVLGWSDNSTANSAPYFSRFLGQHSQDGGAQNIFKSYVLSGNQEYAAITFDFYEIDDWNNEDFIIYIDDVAVFNASFSGGVFNTPADGSAGNVSWSIQELTTGIEDIGFSAAGDQIYRFTLRVDTTAAALKLGFSSTLDEATSDEAWGVDNVTVYEARTTVATPGPLAVAENIANGTNIFRVNAVDADVGDVLTYSITGGTGAAIFAIDSATGMISVLDNSTLNYEATTSYTLDIQVVDDAGTPLDDTAIITINILDVPENTAPVVDAVGPFSVSEAAALNAVVGTATRTDAEGHSVTWSITGGNADNIFSIDVNTGQISVTDTTNLDYETTTSYTLTVQAIDSGYGHLSDTGTIVINILDANEAPVLDTNAGATVNEGGVVILTSAMLSSSDIDAPPDTALIYQVTAVGANGALFNTNTGLAISLNDTFTQGDIDNGYITYTHDGSETISDSFQFTVSDGGITLPAATFSITVTPVNDAPIIQGWTLVSTENFEGGATGWSDNTTENGGTILTEFLGRHSQEAGSQDTFKTYVLSGNQDYVVLSFDFYEIDSWDNEAFRIFIDDAVLFNVNFSNGAFNTPADGSSGILSWQIQELTQFNAHFAYGAGFSDQAYRITLTVDTTAAAMKLGFSSTLDEAIGNEAWGVDNITVYEVNEPNTPGPYHIAENSANGTVVGRVTATDAENDTLTYAATGGTGAGIFTIDANTGIITVINSAALDYESGTTSYTLTIQVTDDGTPNLSDTETITINVLNVQENTAPIVDPLGPISVGEDTLVNTVIGTATATDAELNTITWSITAGNADNIFAIDSVTGSIRIANTANLNFEWDNSHTLTVQARDNGFGTLAGTRNIVINITDVNEAPEFDDVQAVLAMMPGLQYNVATGNFYQYVSGATNYTTATSNAAAATLNGVAGHLVTIMDGAENSYVRGLGGGTLWLGASDAGVEGQWVWAGSGPEGGQTFSLVGVAQPGYYANWGGGEPNNSGGNEHHASMRTDGFWNDIPGGTTYAYVIEWEGAAVLAGLGDGPYTIAENPTLGQSVGFAHATDQDAGDTLTYTVTGGTGAAYFAIDPTTGEITVTDPTAVNFEAATSYTLNLQVEDVAGLIDTITVTINITDINDAPVVATNVGATVDEGDVVTITTAMLSSSDEDAGPDDGLIYTITDVLDYGVLFNTNTGLALGLGDTFLQSDLAAGYITYTHDSTENFTDTLGFTVSDGLLATAAQTFTVTINPVNDAPVIQGWTQVSSEDFEGGAAGWSNNTTENGGAILTRFLGRHSMDGGAQNVFKTYALSGNQDYVVLTFDFYEIDSWDGETFRVFINDTMVYNAAFIQSAYNTPADGSSGIVSWSVQELTPFNTSFAYATNFNDQAYRFTMVVNTTGAAMKLGFSSTLDQGTGDEAWGVDNITIYEVDETNPPGAYHIAENSANGTVVGRVTANDPENDTLTWSITGGTGVGIFNINPATGVITVANSAALDYESGITSYTLDIQVLDDGVPILGDTTTVTINVLDLPENTAPVISAIGPLTVAENALVNTVLGTATATDAELDTITWSITAGNTDNLFAINPTTGAIRLSSTAALNFEWDNSYTITIQARDNGFGLLASTRNVVINITNINEAPTFDIPQSFLDLNPYLRYNSVTGNFYQYVGTTATYAAATATASATLLNGVAGHIATISDVAENGYVRGLGAGSLWLGGSDAGVEGEWVWAGSGPEAGQIFSLGAVAEPGFYTNWVAGQPDNTGNSDFVEMSAAGNWTDVVGTGGRAYVIEWEGAAVMAALGNGPYTMAENPVFGQVVGSAHARDPDAGAVLSYAITGGSGLGIFNIDANTGQITVLNPLAVNYEVQDTFTLDLFVQDQFGLTDTVTVTINITDANDVPTDVILSDNRVTENSALATRIGDLFSVDEDPADTHIYSLVTNPSGKFVIVGNELRTAGNIDYEANQSFSIVIRTDDGNGGTFDKNFIIYVDDVLDTSTTPPAITPPTPTEAPTQVESLPERALTNLVQQSSSETGQFLSFYGGDGFRQILREDISFKIKEIMGLPTENIVQELANSLFVLPSLYDLAQLDIVDQEEEIQSVSNYTNIRQALEFLQDMAGTDDADHTLRDIKDEARAEQLPENTIDRQFVDVLTYHEQRAARLREALLQDA